MHCHRRDVKISITLFNFIVNRKPSPQYYTHQQDTAGKIAAIIIGQCNGEFGELKYFGQKITITISISSSTVDQLVCGLANQLPAGHAQQVAGKTSLLMHR